MDEISFNFYNASIGEYSCLRIIDKEPVLGEQISSKKIPKRKKKSVFLENEVKAVLKVWVVRIAIDRKDTGQIISNHLRPIMRRQVLRKRQHCWENRRQQEMGKTKYETD